MVLNSLPLPSSSNSWEQIFEFRSDPDIKNDMIGLRTWINDWSLTKMSISEIEEKLEWQIIRYKKHLKIHNLKINPGAFESFLIGRRIPRPLGVVRGNRFYQIACSW